MVEPFSCIVPYIRRVTFCFVPPLMNTTTWLLKHLAIINQFWLVKSGNRLSMSTPSHKGFFSCTATVSMGYMYLLLKGCIIFNRFRLFEAFMPLSLRFLIHSQSPYPCTTNFNTSLWSSECYYEYAGQELCISTGSSTTREPKCCTGTGISDPLYRANAVT